MEDVGAMLSQFWGEFFLPENSLTSQSANQVWEQIQYISNSMTSWKVCITYTLAVEMSWDCTRWGGKARKRKSQMEEIVVSSQEQERDSGGKSQNGTCTSGLGSSLDKEKEKVQKLLEEAYRNSDLIEYIM